MATRNKTGSTKSPASTARSRVGKARIASAMDDVDHKIKAWTTAIADRDMKSFEVAIRIQRLSLLGGETLDGNLDRKLHLLPGDADVIANLFEQGPPYSLTPGRLSQLCFVTTGAMTGRIDRLEKRGMLTRTRSESDRRSQWVQLTAKGTDTAVITCRKLLDARFSRAVDRLSATDKRLLLRLLRTVEKNLQD